MPTPTTGTLQVPGATLHYEKRGSGPVLLLIPGGAADAGVYEGMAPDLATRYTVVSYDPRGLSRSALEEPLADQRVEVWSDDAHRLLSMLSPDGEACVFGSSSGAIVALDLLARHPGQLRRVVVHEPPLVELLDDPAPYRALFAEVRETFRLHGAGPAMARFSEGLGDRRTEAPTELPPGIREMAARMHANLPVFLEHMLCPFTATTPDLPALRAAAHKLVVAVGRDSRNQEPLYGPGSRLAELLGGRAVEFPGGHVGCTEHPQEFAQRLLTMLDGGQELSSGSPCGPGDEARAAMA
ncbi:alpha/beta hydrolase [Streptomyces nigrescens]|uniref:alpha/beta fold hydrolase n=1 Tax=Streptomyces nigrescens TaxID=1920 RepID=UPI0034979781